MGLSPVCDADGCKNYLYTASDYGTDAAEIVPDGPERYVTDSSRRACRAHTVPEKTSGPTATNRR